jgi:hypothetical protein
MRLLSRKKSVTYPIHRRANDKRIEEPYLDVRVRIERGEKGVESGRIVVVQQQSHADTTISGGAQAIQQ